MRRPIYRIIRKTYHGREGFLVSGPRCSIFTETRGSAEMIRAKVRAGIETTLADFYSTAPVAVVR